jgi:uncharacterized membrane protein YgaE (UPF0421/DUF939 family)
MTWVRRPVAWDVVYSLATAAACAISYLVGAHVLGAADPQSRLLGGIWTAISTAFVFRDSRAKSLRAGVSRIVATLTSFVLCFFYLCLLSPSVVGMAILLMIGTFVMLLIERRDDIAVAAATTIVVLVVAMGAPERPWLQPVIRLGDTLVRIGIGVACKWLASFVFYRTRGELVR